LPRSISAEKAARTAERKRFRNKSHRSATKRHLTQTEKLIAAGQLEPAQKAVVDSISALDKDAQKGVIHRNTAARRKSRLMKKFNQAKLSGTAQRKADKA